MPYQSYGKKICGDCLLKLDHDFFEVKEYLYENEGASIEEVSEGTGVSRKAIMYMLKEERLIVSDNKGDGGGILTCESCKKPINTGRMCASCKKAVLSAMQESVGTVSVVKRPRQRAAEMEPESIKGVAKLQVK